MDSKAQDINSIDLELAPAVASGNAAQTNTISVDSMFEQSINQQQNHFLLGLSTSAMEIKKILNLNSKSDNHETKKRGRFFKL